MVVPTIVELTLSPTILIVGHVPFFESHTKVFPSLVICLIAADSIYS